MTIKQKFETEDGKLFDTEYDAKLYLGICDTCGGKGTVNGDPIVQHFVDEEATGWMGQYARPVYKQVVTGYKQVTCKDCGGKGHVS